ncbi:FAD/NAD(P)-binding protein [Candidatus Mycobacterium methanotrophicum]|uniref:FAD/NAD(P)-binding protein n=1 Tax=Candidatus Mycobacterium methanotrophicum TaxID=2943498 RepID=A0ABY4QIE1_9MYCO|nr:FAD/NAD(P)-binding protein [Candidatus Mycobacterium methanotrophicum]UQX10309.1 FAD/NAD(P)-binding protein [Candidatus Mycobacterium methanotrophicum]
MTDTATAWVRPPSSAMAPVPHRVRTTVTETFEAVTICLEPAGQRLAAPLPGQFTMLYAFGVGEIAMSVSGDPTVTDESITHTIRAVGAVSQALHDAEVGTIVGVRGPFGTHWDLESCTGRDLVIVGGGCGLAPLRGAVLQVLTVDATGPGWSGQVARVTEPLRRLTLDSDHTTALLCGPERMMWFCTQALVEKGMAPKDVRVSLERNMQCGIGWCGHCQLGPLLLCRDGPVVTYDVADPLMRVKEL